MKKSLISIAVLAALSSTQVNAGGSSYNKNGKFNLNVTCVKVNFSGETDDEYYNGVLEPRGQSGNFLLTVASKETDAEACTASDEFLTTQGVGEDDDSTDEDSIDEDSSDEDSNDEDSTDEDSTDEDSNDEDSIDEDSNDEDSTDEDSIDEDSNDEDSTDMDT